MGSEYADQSAAPVRAVKPSFTSRPAPLVIHAPNAFATLLTRWLAVVILAIFGVGVLYALTQPSIHLDPAALQFGGGHDGSFVQLVKRTTDHLGGRGPALIAAGGWLMAIAAAFRASGESRAPAIVVSVGALLTLAVLIRAQLLIAGIGPFADQSAPAPGNLPIRLMLASGACVIAGTLPWLGRYLDRGR